MLRASDKLVRYRFATATALAGLALVALPATSPAATVKVEEVPGGYANYAHLTFVAAAGESNAVTVAIAGEESDYFKLQVIDSGAPIDPGAMCSGGGTPAATVTCMLHKPMDSKYTLVGGKVAIPVAGTLWASDFNVDLGGGTNSFDAGGLSGENFEGVEMTVSSGAGNDTISTGGGLDTIDPGAGADRVKTGGGYDRVFATATPDGPDVYELGPELGKVDYSRRQEPVVVNGQQAGAVGENDLLIAGSPYVAGGSGDDVLVGGEGLDVLEGNGGNDSIRGGGAYDELVGGSGEDRIDGEGGKDQLVGNPGDDLLVGGAGEDRLYDTDTRRDRGNLSPLPTPEGPSGTDIGLGGPGDDVIVLGGEADRALGDGGNDHLDGQGGSDLLKGGGGQDEEVGGSGHDRLWGGRGADTLFGGRTPGDLWSLVEAPDDGRDLLGCGPDRDVASANPWDDTRGCEVIHTMRPKP